MGGHKIAPNPALIDSYPDVYLSTGLVAENHAREAGISRAEQDAFALRSHQRALGGDRQRPVRGGDCSRHGELIEGAGLKADLVPSGVGPHYDRRPHLRTCG